MSAVDLLCQVTLFADLPDEELRALSCRLTRRALAKNAILYHKGSPARSLYLIESGEVRIFALSGSGQEITLELCGPGECVGEAGLLDGSVRSTGAMVYEKTVVYALSRDDFLACLDAYPQVSRRVITLLVRRLDHATVYAEHLAFLDVTGRVAAVLVEQAQSRGEVQSSFIEVHLTQGELAGCACASREMVSKVIAAFREQGLIATRPHLIEILDLPGLRRKVSP